MKIRKHLVVLVLFLATSGTSSAVTRHVPGDHATIQAALSASLSGDVVLVAPGVYEEHDLVVPDGVTLRGDGVWPGYPTIHATGFDHAVILTFIWENPTRLENLYITGSLVAGLFVENAHQVFVDDCHFQGAGSLSHAVQVVGMSDLTMTDSTIEGWAGVGLVVEQSGPIALSDCTFQSNGGGAVVFEGPKGMTVERCLFRYNACAGGAAGLAVYGGWKDEADPASRSFLVSDCEFRDNAAASGAAALAFQMAGADVVDCLFTDNQGDYVVGYVGFTGGRIERCRILANDAVGVFMWDHIRVELIDTVVGWNTGHGIEGLATTHPLLERTTIVANGGDGLHEPTLNSDDWMRESIIAFNGGAAITAYSFDAEVSCMNVYGNAGGDWTGVLAGLECTAGNFSRDPLFCASTSPTEHLLTADSPCLPGNNDCGVQIGAGDEACVCGKAFADDLSRYVHGGETDVHYGVALGDYDGDGDPDVFLAGNAADGSPANALFRTQTDQCAALADVTALHGVVGIATARAAKWGDYDEDGDLDLFVANTGGANQLFENAGPGAGWPDVAATVGVIAPGDDSGDAAWVDYDLDGDLDLYVTIDGPNRLYSNDGPPWWGFTEVGAAVGVDEPGRSRSAVWADYDDDGDPDLYLANYDAAYPNRLLRNDGGTFSDVTAGALGDAGAAGGACWGDYDNDGDLDLYVVNYGTANRLFTNQGPPAWSFVENAASAGLDDDGYGRGAAWVDFDNDGDLDLHVADWADNHLYRNDGGLFVDVAAAAEMADNRSGRGVAWGDLDGDGRLDCVVANHGSVNRLFRNLDCSRSNWLQIDLVDADGHRGVIGARIRIESALGGQIREIDGGGGYCSQGWATAHFGLAGNTFVNELEVRWPDGEVQTLRGVAPNRRVTVIQGVTDVGDIPAPALDLTVHPNPFNPRTTVSFEVPDGGAAVALGIFDLRGALVSRLFSGRLRGGRHVLTWEGRDADGALLPSGVYTCELRVGGEAGTRSLTLLR